MTIAPSTRNVVIAVAIVVVIAVAVAVSRLGRWRSLVYVSRFVENPGKLIEGASLYQMNVELLRHLQRLSRSLGRKLHINSGFRTLAKNTAVGGAGHSAHLDGDAADIAVGSESALDLARLAYRQGIRRIGLGAHYVHIDVSDTLPAAIWTYDGSGFTKAQAIAAIKN